MLDLTTKQPGQVARAQRAIQRAPDTRRLKQELQANNHYATTWLRTRGLAYHQGMIGSPEAITAAVAHLAIDTALGEGRR